MVDERSVDVNIVLFRLVKTMSFNDIHRLKPQNLKEVIVYVPDFLGNRVPVDSYWVSVDEPTDPSDSQVDQSFADYTEPSPIKVKRQTGGVISGRNFPSR